MALEIIDANLQIFRLAEGPGNRYRKELRFKIRNTGNTAVNPVYIRLSEDDGGKGFLYSPNDDLFYGSVEPNTTTAEIYYEAIIRTDKTGNHTGIKHRIELIESSNAIGQYATKIIYASNTAGCKDATALNYNYYCTADDGTCMYTTVYGCTDPSASNYNLAATDDDGTCIFGPKTGYKAWATLQEYDILSGKLTGNTKPNVPADPDYVLPIFDPKTCPI